VAELRRCAGTDFDPVVVEALASVLHKEPETVV
jgi:HD-GYP domain-containing protein (c-di-GMP phosphodiesterase class II)